MSKLTYQYTPLSPQSREIRLVRLHPGSRQVPLECDMILADLGTAPTYEALSYTWGDNTRSQYISLDGHHFPIGENLSSALRGLRLLEKEKIFWIDAICINQSDIAERNRQVAQMRHIYEQASTTIIWLGEEADNSRVAFEFVSELAGLTQVDKNYKNGTPEGRKKVFNMSRLGDWQALDALVNRPWWSRAWVVQEATVSKKAIAMCGKDAVEWNTFLPAFAVPRAWCISSRQFWIDAGRTHSQTMKYSLIGSFPNRNDEVTTTLRDLLAENRSKFATDPRDKVFALIGLADDSTESSFQPDYSKSVQAVYKETTKDVITRESSLAILEYAGLSRLQIELPSWCVDWTYGEGDDDNIPVPIRTLSWLLRTFDLSPSDPNITLYGHDVAAASTVQTVAVFDESLSTLRIAGIAIGKISALGMVFWRDKYYEGVNESSVLGKGCKSPYFTGEVADVAINQTRCGGFWRDSKGDETEDQKLLSILRSAWEDRRFAVTETGYLALVPSDSTLKDEIYVVAGCEVPLVLRDAGGSKWLIGQSYVHGAMHGEILVDVEGRSRNWEDVTLQ